jgi:hypothetical protein
MPYAFHWIKHKAYLIFLFTTFTLSPGSINLAEGWLNSVAEILSKWTFYHGGRHNTAAMEAAGPAPPKSWGVA